MDGGGLLLDGDGGDSLTQNMKGDSQTADFIHNAFNDLTQVTSAFPFHMHNYSSHLELPGVELKCFTRWKRS